MNKYYRQLREPKGLYKIVPNKIVPIRNEPKKLGTKESFAQMLISDRERAVVNLCKFLTGKRKKVAMSKLRGVTNEQLVLIAGAKGWLL